MRRALCLVLAACSSTPRGPTLPASALDVAAPPAPAAVHTPVDVGGATWFEAAPTDAPCVLLAVDAQASDAATQVLAHMLRRAVSAHVPVPTRVTVHPAAIQLTLDSPQADVARALDAIHGLPLDDLAMAGPLRTRRDGLGPVTPESVRAVHTASATRTHVVVLAPPGQSGALTVLEAWDAGTPLPADHPMATPMPCTVADD